MNFLQINFTSLIADSAQTWILLSQSREERKLLDWIFKSVTESPVIGYTCLVVGLSVITFLVYGWDKRQAKVDGWRVPEKRLHALSFLGGWPGAMAGQNYFRHKTQKFDFKLVNWLAAAVHVALIAWYLYSLIG